MARSYVNVSNHLKNVYHTLFFLITRKKITRSKTQVLQGATGELNAGNVCAIMGPSGAGKTSFMSTLAGRATYVVP